MILLFIALILLGCASPCPPPQHTVEYRWIDPPKFSFLQCVETLPDAIVPGFVGRIVSRIPPDSWRISDGDVAITIEEKFIIERTRPGDVCRSGT